MFELVDSWVWDNWVVTDSQGLYHAFFLFASRALGDESRRHRHASVGHATSPDLRVWTRVEDALVRSEAPAIDDVATWTGSVVPLRDGTWRMFYTALSDTPTEKTQVVTWADSADLLHWSKSGRVAARASDEFYATAATTGIEPFRDPWIVRGDGGEWHMFVAASSRTPTDHDHGVVGHAVSDDLTTWRAIEPSSVDETGFGEIEVPSVFSYKGEFYLLFSCLRGRMTPSRRAQSPSGGIWIAPAAGPHGPFDLDGALPLTSEELYAGHVVTTPEGELVLLAFENVVDGAFVGRMADPVPLGPLMERAKSGETRRVE